jgi:hypothetical protein
MLSVLSLFTYTLARFGAQEQFYPPIAARITEMCPLSTDNEGICETLRGDAIVPVLANAGACDQQRHAELFVDFAKTFFPGNKTNELLFIKIAQDYRVMERNTNQDGKCSPICLEIPRNSELLGLIQAQDPGCDISTLAIDTVVAGGAVIANIPTTTSAQPETTTSITTQEPLVTEILLVTKTTTIFNISSIITVACN